MSSFEIKGSIVALVTPFTEDNKIDTSAAKKLIDWHIKAGTDAIVVAGTTGESPTLTESEFSELIKVSVKHANKKIPIIAGTGTNSTSSTIDKTKLAKELGVDACLIVAPYYNRPTQEGIFLHYHAITNAVDIPIILYNVPTRTSSDISVDTTAKLSKINNIVGIKDATGDISRLKLMLDNCANGFKFYSGDDDSFVEFMQNGGHGVISVSANVAPVSISNICKFLDSSNNPITEQDITEAVQINNKLVNLHQVMMVEPNPIPVKWALFKLGIISPNIRLPLTTLSKANQEKVMNCLSVIGADDYAKAI